MSFVIAPNQPKKPSISKVQLPWSFNKNNNVNNNINYIIYHTKEINILKEEINNENKIISQQTSRIKELENKLKILINSYYNNDKIFN